MTSSDVPMKTSWPDNWCNDFKRIFMAQTRYQSKNLTSYNTNPIATYFELKNCIFEDDPSVVYTGFFCYLKKIISNHNTRSYVFDRLKLKQKWLFVARRLRTGAVVGLNISKWLYQISKFLSFGLNIHLNIVTVFRALFQQSSVNLKQGL